MPILNGQFEPDGALVGLRRPEVRKLRAAGRPLPAPVAVRALLDTGAECTCIDPQALGGLSLPLKGLGLTNVPALGGLTATPQRDASLTIIHPAGAAQNLVIHEHPVVELALGQLGYQMLIGRDLLDQWLFVRNGPASTFSLSY
jgi:Retroviral aspartyl protease